ncbi:MAG: CPBP family intramembrane metalloprotease [Desmonostoc vinosum HA7617-LM4]|jgi:membrane protease YdiL (CAAX protease family)|nr:CPBP family intramembrane metalloprotease [Desmonostoc vinosum HA7617-LM4]
MTPYHLYNPFHYLKVRHLLLRGLLISLGLGFALGFIQGSIRVQLDGQLLMLLLYILIFGLLSAWELVDFNRLGIKLKHVVGNVPNNHKWLPTAGLVILMLLFSLSAYLVSFYLLSLAAPSFIEELMRQVAADASPRTSAPLLYNLLVAIVYVVVAPIAEEFLFRGIILQRWATKWGIRTALLASSLMFGIGHANVVGLSLFGVIMGVLYIKTRTLIVPIACHALNNLLAVALGFLSDGSNATASTNVLEELRSGWRVGILLMLVSLPLLVRFLYQNWPRKNAVVPYFLNIDQEVGEE